MKHVIFPVIFFCVCSYANADERVRLPENYPEAFIEYLALDRTQNPDQFIKLFANQTALKGSGESEGLPEGSVLVAEVYSVKKDAAGKVKTSALDRRIANQLLLIAVMEKRTAFGESPASPIRTGDWNFAAYKPNGETAPKNLDECRACHAPLSDADFVFSIEHLPMPAK